MTETAAWRPPIEGSWYPEDLKELTALCQHVWEKSAQRTGPSLRTGALGFVVPHAAPMYSGAVAMATYRTLREQNINRIVLIAFSHWQSHRGIWIPNIERYCTAFGDLWVNREGVESLAALPVVKKVPPQSASDHSLEVQIPLIQFAVPDATIVPIYVGGLTPQERQEVAQALAGMLDEPGTALVASSDLTHYGPDFGYTPFPPNGDIAANLRALDHAVLESSGSLDENLFLQTLAETETTVCGHASIRLLLRALELRGGEELFPETLDYQTSGEISQDWKHSVSYGAQAFYPASAWQLSDDEGRSLLEAARRTLADYQATGQRRPIAAECRSRGLALPAACFVSLHREGQLRGCIGSRSAFEPLGQAVSDMTIAAATSDPRMSPVAPYERDIQIEISVLTSLKRISSPDLVEAGAHGAYLENHGHSAILLPQVASQYGLTKDQFLSELAAKAGLARDAWRKPEARLSVFRAQIFGAED